jgi:hypothetical protein
MPGLLEKDQVGKREDLADLVAIVDVRGTPFASMVNKSRRPANTLFDWQVDAYESPQVTGTVDGKDVAEYENAAKNRAKLHNQVQIFRRTAKVSRLAENVSVVAGVASEMATAVAKKLVEIKRDIEATLLGDNDCQADDGAKPYLTRGLDAWIQTSAQSLYPVPAAYRPASGQVIDPGAASGGCATLTEAGATNSVQALLQAIFDATGMNGRYVLFAGSTLRRRFTDMTRTGQYGNTNVASVARIFTGELSGTTVTQTTTVFEGDYGTVEIIPSNFIGGTTVQKSRAYLLDMNKVHLRYNKLPTVESLPDLGGGPRRLIEAVGGLQVDNPIGLGKMKHAGE